MQFYELLMTRFRLLLHFILQMNIIVKRKSNKKVGFTCLERFRAYLILDKQVRIIDSVKL